jgi:hypothetical protein
MNISDQIIAIINDLCEKLGFAIDWSAENILPKIEALCIKYINYEIATSIFYMALWLSITGLLWLITGILWRRESKLPERDRWDCDYFHSFVTVAMIVISCFISFITICVIGAQAYDIVEAKVFPEKVIYEFISKELATLKN